MITLTQDSLMNRLFCSFTSKDRLEERLVEINSQYKILYNKIFVLASPESDEYMCTYNIEVEGPETRMLNNTILLHRKKETNTLYTINALNTLIISLNNGMMDNKFPINWAEYRNSMLLTQGSEFRRLNTIVHKIVATS
jgi:hypothetical protein